MSKVSTKEQPKTAEGLIDLLKQPWVVERFKGLAQEHLSAERMLFLAIECVRRTPTFGECDHLSVLGALITSLIRSDSFTCDSSTFSGLTLPFSRYEISSKSLIIF